MKSYNFKYFVVLLIVFLISANLAWLNPRNNDPDYPRLYKTHNIIPLFWQYNLDSGIEILTTAYFPKIFKKDNTRIDRPTYPALANFLGKTIGLILKPLIKLNELEKAGIGYITLKILIYSLSIILARKILLNYFDEKTTFLAIFFTYAHNFSIFNLTSFSTTDAQFTTPIFILFIFIYLIKNYSISKNILFSIIVGILMLAKSNYAIYLSIIIFLFYKKEWSIIFISIFAHLVPIFLYLSFIKYLNYDFQIIGATEYDQGTWLYEDLKNLNFYNIFNTAYLLLGEFFIKILFAYRLVIIFSILGFLLMYLKNKIKTDYLVFIGIFIFCTYFQMFVASRYTAYMTYDIAIIVYAFAAFGIYQIIDKFKNYNVKKFSIPIIMVFYLIFNVVIMIQYPWVHPYNQVAKTPEALNAHLSKYDNITIED